jgi:hypothetical protein
MKVINFILTMRIKHDWEEIKKRYVTGSDLVTPTTIAQEFGIPHVPQVSKRIKDEDWKKQRQLYRERKQIKGIIVEHDDMEAAEIFDKVESTKIQVKQLVDEVEAITRHINIAKLLQSKAVEAMKTTDPKKLKPSDISAFLRLGTDIEKQAMNLAGENINMDNMTKEELEKIANGNA